MSIPTEQLDRRTDGRTPDRYRFPLDAASVKRSVATFISRERVKTSADGCDA